EHHVDQWGHVDAGDFFVVAACSARHGLSYFKCAKTIFIIVSALAIRRFTVLLNALKAMTAGIATSRPTAVATSASEIPAITTDGPPAGLVARSLNAMMIPITVPKRPMNGALFPS